MLKIKNASDKPVAFNVGGQVVRFAPHETVEIGSKKAWNTVTHPVPGFNGYRAGSDGSIWRERDGNLIECKQSTRRDGYRCTGVMDDTGKRGPRYVHRLVALAFHGEPGPGQEVRHLNGDPTDNRPVNLAWGTRTENKEDEAAHRTDEIKEYGGPGKRLTKADARDMREARAKGTPVNEIARCWGVSVPHASRILNDHSWSEDGRPGGNYDVGGDRPSSKLDEGRVGEIKRMLADGATLKEIAGRFGVTMACVSNIRTGRTWGYVEAASSGDARS